MSSNYDRQHVFSSMIWKFMERGGSMVIQLGVQIMLARLLSPSEFGTLAIVLVFINLARTFVDGGFSTALIQKKNADKLDFSSVFYLSLAIAATLSLVIMFIAPFVADFYGDESLTPLLRTLSLILFPGALNSVQNAFVARNMEFKKLFKTSLLANLISGIFGIISAYLGVGVWALVIQQITFAVVNSIALWFVVSWRPQLIFSLQRVKILFTYGSRILGASFIYTFYLDLRTLIIGGVYTSADLAYYQRGEQIPRLLVDNVDGSIQSVILPTLSAHQEEKERIKSMVRRTVTMSSFFVFPMMAGLFVVSETLIRFLLTDKWLPAVPFFQVFCITYALWPILTINLQPIRALGKSDLILRLEIIKRVIGITIIIVSIQFGLYAMALGAFLERFIEVILNAYPNKHLINYSLTEQFLDIWPSLLQSVLMGMAVYALNFLDFPPFILLFVQALFGMCVYVLLAFIFKNQSLNYILSIIQGFISKRK